MSALANTPDLNGGAPLASDDPGPETRRGAIALAAFALVFLVGGALTPLDAAVIGAGRVVVAGSRQAVQSRDGGIVSALAVREGQKVKAGDILLRIDSTELVASESVLARQTVVARMLEARLRAQLDGARTFARPPWMNALAGASLADAESAYLAQLREFSANSGSLGAQMSVLDQRAAQSQADLVGLDGQIVAVTQRIKLTQDQLADIRSLYDKGYAPLTRVRGLEASIADLQGQLINLKSNQVRASTVIGEINQQRHQVRTGRVDVNAEKLREVQTELLTLEPKLAATRAQIARSEVRATASGSVVGLSIFTVGGVVAPGQVLMEIVPEKAPLVIEASIRPQDAENIHPGQKAQVRFTLSHSRRAPRLMGKVISVSADRFVDEKSGGAFFKVQAELPPEEIARLKDVMPAEANIGAGLSADVVIPVRGRTALGYLLDPLRDALWLSFRED